MAETSKRRHLTVEEKLRILEEAQQPGVQIAELCRRHGIGTSQFYTWREQARQGAKTALTQPAGWLGELSRTSAEGKAEALALVQRTHERSRWPIQRILRALALPRPVYYAAAHPPA